MAKCAWVRRQHVDKNELSREMLRYLFGGAAGGAGGAGGAAGGGGVPAGGGAGNDPQPVDTDDELDDEPGRKRARLAVDAAAVLPAVIVCENEHCVRTLATQKALQHCAKCGLCLAQRLVPVARYEEKYY